MKEILASGVTGLLVSHSVGQVRELCNKVLWLDHGRQIAFGDQVMELCDAYEEFLITRQLPESEEALHKLAHNLRLRRAKERKEKQRTETERLQAVLEQGTSDAAIEASLRILRAKRPELLKE